MDCISKIRCPHCLTEHIPEIGEAGVGPFQIQCLHCGKTFQFRSLAKFKSSVSLTINGTAFTLDNKVRIKMSLNEFIREVAQLKGTKVMCREGGCGSCVVNASYFDLVSKKLLTVGVNSCLVPVLSCDGWDITTVEGIGNRHIGYHPIQQKIAAFNATQCGFCTSGMVMNMYSLLEANPSPSKELIEKSFDGNICRCTGFRPILDAMKSFGSANCADIEDLCRTRCLKDTNEERRAVQPVLMNLGTAMWQKPTSLAELYSVVDAYKGKSVRFVVGNTSTGIYKDDGPYDIYIDTKGILELYLVSTEEKFTIGANVSLFQFEELLMNKCKEDGYEYCESLALHIRKVANVPVRNVASWAGNLMTKYYHADFPSDIFLILSTVLAQVTIGSSSGTTTCLVENLPSVDMAGKVILKLDLLPWSASDGYRIMTYKIMPRSQNAHAYINAGFFMKISGTDKQVVAAPRILYGGIGRNFLRASKTERQVYKKNINDPDAVKEVLKMLYSEIVPESFPVLSSAKFRKDLAASLLYKFCLSVLGTSLPTSLQSGMLNIERPMSSGIQEYDTDKTQWPLTQPLSKVTAINQAAGEAEYVNDIPAFPGQLYGAFVISQVGPATVAHIDTTEALQMAGVKKFIAYTDIPEKGVNNWMPTNLDTRTMELFCSGKILYAGQALGFIVADSQAMADMAASKVKIDYKDTVTPVTDLSEAIEKQMFFPKPVDDIVIGDADAALKASDLIVQGEIKLGTQYHFNMETQSCLCVPKENMIEVFPTTQGPEASQSSIAQVLGISNSQVSISVRRLGGGFGSKLTGNFAVGAATALAAKLLNKPVHTMMNFNTNMEMVGRRCGYVAKYEVGISKEGKLNGIKITVYGDHGCSPTDSTMAITFQFIDNAYHCPNWHVEGVAVRTDTPSTTSCRAPGMAPGIFIMETMMEHVAQVVKKDPLIIKQMNFYQKGQVTPVGQPVTDINLPSLLQEIHTTAEIAQRLQDIDNFNTQNRWKKKGLGVVPMKYGVGWNGTFYNVIVSVYGHDGSVAVMHGGIEMGQGINTKVIQMCAHTLGIPMDTVTVYPAEMVAAANSNMSGGSVTSEMCCIGVRQCCNMLLERIAVVRKKYPRSDWAGLISECYKEGVDLIARKFVLPNDTLQPSSLPFAYNTYGVTVAEVELDVLTGENQVNRVDILSDCGQSMNPDLDIGQIEGAFVMGLGYWLHEEIRYDPQTGRNVTNGTWEYKPPTTLDIPVDFRVRLLKNSSNPVKIIRSKAVGEPPLCMSCAVLFGLKRAIEEARKEAGNVEYFSVGPPTTVEYAQQLCLPSVENYVIQV